MTDRNIYGQPLPRDATLADFAEGARRRKRLDDGCATVDFNVAGRLVTKEVKMPWAAP